MLTMLYKYSQANEELTNGDLANIFALGGLIQGIGFLFGK